MDPKDPNKQRKTTKHKNENQIDSWVDGDH